MRKRHRWIAVALLSICLGGAWSVAIAQTADPSAAEPTAEEQVEQKTSLMGLLKQGGILMWPLGLLSVATIALGVYGFMFVRPGKMLTPELVPDLQQKMVHLDLKEAMAICSASPSLLTNILIAGLRRIEGDEIDATSMEKAMEEASVEETAGGLRTIGYLSLIAQIAPMVGLLGTVSGMIKAFDKIGKGAMGKPEVLAGNIGEALITTATGLMIGIPAMFLYFHLKGKYTANLTRLGRVLGNLSHHLVSASRGHHPGVELMDDAPMQVAVEDAV
ncbi:MAG: MotA/TolQ/ExbB proton channel family protein [Kiritimatiellae bacterium]|nr:MotA/TolQ/ExbB proton channel family protein [Kiritimatiellia bacterium]